MVSQMKGKVRLFRFNPRYAFLGLLVELLKQAYSFLPQGGKEQFYVKRKRPRRTGKDG